MNKVFELKYKSGPHGDACTTYDIIFKKDNVKLYEFLEDLPTNECGTIYISILNPLTAKLDYATKDEKYKELKIEYNNGEYKTEGDKVTSLPNLYKNIDLEYNSWANGGWGSMSYWIMLKD